MISSASPTILIVEDNELSGKLFRIALTAAGFAVEAATDGRAALEMIARRTIDLVLLDIRLPDMDGFDVADQIRANQRTAGIPIIVCSALPREGDHARGVRARIADYLFKPVSPDDVVAAVRLHLAERQPSPGGARYRVLVVDDDSAQRKLTATLLGAGNYDVVVASDGVEALEVARRLTPDAIVSDVLMPRLDGFRLCAEVRKDAQLAGVPVILCSSEYTEPPDADLAARVGANALVRRTPDQEQVLAALDSALASGAVPVHITDDLTAVEPYLQRVSWQLDRQLGMNAQLLRRLAVREAELSILGHAAHMVTRGDSTTETLEELLHACLNAAGLSRGAIYLFGPDGALGLSALLGYGSAQRSMVSRFFGKLPFLVAACDAQQSTLVPGSLSRAESDALLRLADLRGLIVTPIRGGGESLGVLWMGSESREIDANWAGFSQAVASQMGHAVLLGRSFTRVTKAERRYRSIFEGAGEGLFQLSSNGGLAMANDALARSLGYERPDQLLLAQREFGSLLVDPAEGVALLEASLSSPATAELQARQLNGEPVWLHITVVAVKDPSGVTRSFDGVALDVTDRRRLHQLRTIEETQRMQMQIKDQFLSQVSHELRTPLAAMHQYLTILLDGLAGEVPAQQREHLDTILRNTVQLRGMIDDLLEVSHGTGTSLVITAAPMSIRDVILDAVDTFGATARGKNVSLTADVAAPLPLVLADSARVTQILVNLIGNAIKFTPESGRVTVCAIVDPDHEHLVRVSVADTGSGIHEADQARVFDYLFQGKSGSNSTRRGFGIGLYVCRDLVTRQGGRIWLNSAEGHGTSFYFTLPQTAAVAALVAQP